MSFGPLEIGLFILAILVQAGFVIGVFILVRRVVKAIARRVRS